MRKMMAESWASSHGCAWHCANSSSKEPQRSNRRYKPEPTAHETGDSARAFRLICGIRCSICGGGWRVNRENLHERRGGRLGRARGRFVLGAGGCIEIDGDSAWDEDGRVITEIEIAGNPVNDWKSCEKDQTGEPAGVDTVAAAGKPERSHGIAFNDGRVAADTSNC